MLAFSSDGFTKFLTTPIPASAGKKPEVPVPPYLDASVAFVHFILVQTLALLLAIICSGLPTSGPPAVSLLWGVSWFVFVYGLFSAVAATMRIFILTVWFNHYAHLQRTKTAPDCH